MLGDPASAYDFGLGAGFYVDAAMEPFAKNYRMWSYVTEELPKLVVEHFPADPQRQSILGHSMGGHGALTIALRHRDRYRAASAFSPIVAPSQVPWGTKALGGYLGDDKQAWRGHDAVALIEDGARFSDLLVDYGDADPFLAEQLRPELLQAACEKAEIPLTLRCQPGYDHSYYFISTFMSDHLRWHAATSCVLIGPSPIAAAARRSQAQAAGCAPGSSGRATRIPSVLPRRSDAHHADELSGRDVAQVDVDVENEVRNLLHHIR